MKGEIEMIDYHFNVKIDFYFEFLMLSSVSNFHEKWETKYKPLFDFNSMIIFTNMVYTLFESKFVSSPLRFYAA